MNKRGRGGAPSSNPKSFATLHHIDSPLTPRYFPTKGKAPLGSAKSNGCRGSAVASSILSGVTSANRRGLLGCATRVTSAHNIDCYCKRSSHASVNGRDSSFRHTDNTTAPTRRQRHAYSSSKQRTDRTFRRYRYEQYVQSYTLDAQ